MFLPGAAVAVGYKEARRVPLGWKAKVDSDERFAWWPAAAEKHPSIEPLKVSRALSLACSRLLGCQSLVPMPT